jgi:hypothetical protein
MRRHGAGWLVAAIFAWMFALALLLPSGSGARKSTVSIATSYATRGVDRSEALLKIGKVMRKDRK